MKKSPRKLSLNKQTVRNIAPAELNVIAGGNLNPQSVGCSQVGDHCGTQSVISACGCTHD